VRLIFALVLAASLLAAGRAGADPSRDLLKAKSEFEQGQYRAVILTVEPLLYPNPLLRAEKELVDAHFFLGMAYFYTDRKDQARTEFAALLYTDPDYKLDPVMESPEVYAFFEDIKRSQQDQLEERRRQLEKEAEAKRRPSREVLVTRTIRDRSPWENFLPFGVGQFRNGQQSKGYAFLVGQLMTGGTSLGLFVAQAVQYGIPSRGVPLSDIDGLRTRQVVQIGAGAVFLLLYGWSVIDAFANQKPKIEETKEERPITELDRPPPLIVPWVAPEGGGGVVFTWTF
jgi:hypothetical protein